MKKNIAQIRVHKRRSINITIMFAEWNFWAQQDNSFV